MNKFKTIFFGTPEFSVAFLQALIKTPFLDVVAVITEPDRPKGRGKVMCESPVAQYYNSNLQMYPNASNSNKIHRFAPSFAKASVGKQNDKKIIILKPSKIVNCKLKIENLRPDVAVVVAYGQIIPQEILDIPKFKVINVHPSDLPKYRGPSPIQTALLNGEKQSMISIMKMDEKMDHGPIIDKLPINIDINDNYQSLEEKILQKGPEFLIKTINTYLNYCSMSEATKTKDRSSRSGSNNMMKTQDHTKATFSKMIKKEDGLIDWNKSPFEIHNKIRAYSAWPKAYTFIGNKRLNILKSEFSDNKLVLKIVQLEGKKPVLWNDFNNGYAKIIPKEILDKLK